MDALQQQEIDLIILDLRMPGPVDGEQLLFTLRDAGQ
jgi:CheY-like chemotaxis protein